MLAHETIGGGGARRALFLHGILGSGANLRTIARRFVAACPGWDALLVDLRGHGGSPKSGAEPTLAAAARDVAELAPMAAIVGHSFGAKVALAAAAETTGVSHVVMIDSPPGAREPQRSGDSALAVIEMLRSLPSRFASKADFVAAVKARGHSQTLAQWLAMSTEPDDGGVRLLFDLDEIETLVLDHFRQDLWPLVERIPAAVHFVIGDRSSSWSREERERAQALAARDGRITVDVLPTDHWVHVEDPDGLLRALTAHIGEC